MSAVKTPGDDELPTPEDILASEGFDAAASEQYQTEVEREFSAVAVQSEVEWAHLKGLQDHYWHKGNWSWFLMGIMSAMIIFQSFLLGLVGAGVWGFSKYEWLLPALLVQNLGQIIALAFVVVRSLFRDQGFVKPEK
ncbi:hypothetical protein ABK249_02270 [Neorhizobium sp. Rsf11]|uniref:Uncharacterized protein n=1 Tax=Neorhizobium phenanthreniclasticum TaxID=3157917 RepID=A0ABV0LVX3_9HYPH